MSRTLLPSLLLGTLAAWAAIGPAHSATPQAAPASAPLPAASAAAPATAPLNAAALYQQHCASCHGEQRIGLMGPALLPESLERIRPAEVLRVIREGRQATQMAGYASVLSEAEMQALADWVRTPVTPAPRWSEADIRASRSVTPMPPDEPNRPVWDADPMNLFIVVEAGDHHITLLDGDKLSAIARFPSRFALHGGPKVIG